MCRVTDLYWKLSWPWGVFSFSQRPGGCCGKRQLSAVGRHDGKLCALRELVAHLPMPACTQPLKRKARVRHPWRRVVCWEWECYDSRYTEANEIFGMSDRMRSDCLQRFRPCSSPDVIMHIKFNNINLSTEWTFPDCSNMHATTH